MQTALGHRIALSLLTLMLGSALATKPRATKRDATSMIRSLGFGLDRNAEPQLVDSAAVKLIKRGPEYSILKSRFSGVADAIGVKCTVLHINHVGKNQNQRCAVPFFSSDYSF